MLYFAYGANLNLRGMKRRCPRATALSVATLKGFRLEFRTFVTIVPDPATTVSGALYELTPACLRALEEYEGESYVQQDVTVETEAGQRAAMVFLMRGGERTPPSLPYFSEISRGYSDWKLAQEPLRRARIATMHAVKPEKLPREKLRKAGDEAV